jgi:adenine-specific DNA-methyltransferase
MPPLAAPKFAVHFHSIMTPGATQLNFELFDDAEDGVTEGAYRAGLRATRRLTREEQRGLGQYMTPVAIATEMARRSIAAMRARESWRILDPAAGSGVLAAAAVQAALDCGRSPRRIELLMCEIDERLHDPLRELAGRLASACAQRAVMLECKVTGGDFLLSDLAVSGAPTVDLVIANPPYFKLGKQDRRAQAHLYAVHGQPNIYGLFMAACASLVREGGVWCFITPRSWTGGDYFAAVRRHLFARLNLAGLHAFDSRSAHFDDDEVLQEAIVTWAASGGPREAVDVGVSVGAAGMAAARRRSVPVSSLVGPGPALSVRLPSAGPGIERLRGSLARLGWRVSTGPVVAFRARRWLAPEAGPKTVPLLWMQHVRRMSVQWPLARKLEHVERGAGSSWMLVANRPMVLLRRFSPKEDARRVTAAPWLGGGNLEVLGLENHLNYICAVDDRMTRDEANGLAAYLNSGPVDAWLRDIVGHTQINAADLRRMPMPEREVLADWGRRLGPSPELAVIDAIVGAYVESAEEPAEPAVG